MLRGTCVVLRFLVCKGVVMPRKQHCVRLSRDDRRVLTRMVRTGQRSAWSLQRARILLASDAAADDGPAATDVQVATAVGGSPRTVARTAVAWTRQGLACLQRTPQAQPSVPPKLATAQTREIAAVACTDPPPGCARWSLRLITVCVLELEIVDSICPETARRPLKKGGSTRGARRVS